MAKLTYESLAEVPEDLRDEAKEDDGGKYIVNVSLSSKVKEFRDKNISVVQERDNMSAALSQYEQVTGVPILDLEDGKLTDFASALESLRETKKRVEDGKLVEETSLEEATANRLTEATNSFKTQLSDMAKDRDVHKTRADSADKRAEAMQVENAIRLAASDSDIAMIDKAVSFVMPKALSTFRVDEGKIVPKAVDGTVLYGSDGVTPMSMKEWLLKERDENDFLFRGAKGGGASGNGDTAPGRITQAELDKMSPQQKMQWARKNQTAA